MCFNVYISWLSVVQKFYLKVTFESILLNICKIIQLGIKNFNQKNLSEHATAKYYLIISDLKLVFN